LVFDPCGVEIARYDKKHFFDVDVQDQNGSYRESDTFEPGDALSVVTTAFGTVGLSVCYDLRFPEFFTRLAALGAEIIAVPSAFTAVPGAAHFEVLIRARAIGNACFIVAACQSGGHDSGRETFGHYGRQPMG
jgi:predicted amidohydrolase